MTDKTPDPKNPAIGERAVPPRITVQWKLIVSSPSMPYPRSEMPICITWDENPAPHPTNNGEAMVYVPEKALEQARAEAREAGYEAGILFVVNEMNDPADQDMLRGLYRLRLKMEKWKQAKSRAHTGDSEVGR